MIESIAKLETTKADQEEAFLFQESEAQLGDTGVARNQKIIVV
jgi:hypothetical protein